MIALLLHTVVGCLSVQAETTSRPQDVPSPAETTTGGGCASSCALDAAPGPPLTRAGFEDLLNTWSVEPIGEPTLALETLLFHGPVTRAWLHQVGDGALDADHAAFLDKELARNQVSVEMRLLDDQGEERGTLVANNVNLADKQHLTFEGTGSLGRLETGGKVKRVGLGHLWSRW